MEFGIEKFAMHIRNGGKRQTIEGIEWLNQERIRIFGEKENYKHLEILEADTIKQVEMKENIRKKYIRQMRKLFETKLCSWNLIKGINTQVVPHVRYLRPFLKWNSDKWIRGQKNDDDAQGFTWERWHK